MAFSRSITSQPSQPLDSDLTDIAGLANTDSNIIVGDGSNWVAESGATARTSLGAAALSVAQAFIAVEVKPEIGLNLTKTAS